MLNRLNGPSYRLGLGVDATNGLPVWLGFSLGRAAALVEPGSGAAGVVLCSSPPQPAIAAAMATVKIVFFMREIKTQSAERHNLGKAWRRNVS